MIKQVIIVRKDLNMRKGKIAAQVAHASMKVFFDRMSHLYPEVECGLFTKNMISACKFTPEMVEWMEETFTKVVVGCNSLEDIMKFKKQADRLDIPNALIIDNGITEFKNKCDICNGVGLLPTGELSEYPDEDICECGKCDGKGIIDNKTTTCLAIGPDKAEKIDVITGHLKLI